ncbi:MAG TPA: hypothetical protein VE650_07540 [Acetobacteraceae bacterium]|nr:hypothetical protein [Acetobacteraceae bacterium]
MVHELVILSLHHGLHDVLDKPALAALGVSLSLVVATLFYRAVERPSHNLARYASARLEGDQSTRARALEQAG